MAALVNTVVKCDGPECIEVEPSTSEVFHNGFVLTEVPEGWVRVGERKYYCPCCRDKGLGARG